MTDEPRPYGERLGQPIEPLPSSARRIQIRSRKVPHAWMHWDDQGDLHYEPQWWWSVRCPVHTPDQDRNLTRGVGMGEWGSWAVAMFYANRHLSEHHPQP